jgi:hypothetical protein
MRPRTILAIALIAAFSFNLVYAQDSDTQLYMIHEDLVIPAQVFKYMETTSALKQAMEDNNVATMGFSTFRLDDNTWWLTRPIPNYAVFDNYQMKELFDKMGEEEAMALLSKFNGTYHEHRNFVAVFHPSLSYKPEGAQEPGNNYREWMYLYYDDKDQEAMIEVMKEWKALYEAKGIDHGYSIFTAGLGHYGPVLVVHSWAESEAMYAAASEDTMTKLGDERMELLRKTMPLVQKQDVKRGMFMPDHSYTPQQ